MSVPQSPVITPSAGWENAGRGRLTAPRVTTKPAMWSIINRLAKWHVPYCGFEAAAPTPVAMAKRKEALDAPH